MAAFRAAIALLLGRAAALSFVGIEDYDGSTGDGGDFGGSASDGSSIVLYGQEYYDDDPYLTILDGSLAYKINQFPAEGDGDSYEETPTFVQMDDGEVTYYCEDATQNTAAYTVEEWYEDDAYVLDVAWSDVDQIQRYFSQDFLVLEASNDLVKFYGEYSEWTVTADDLGFDDVDSFLFVHRDDHVDDDAVHAFYVVGNVADSSSRGVAKIAEYDGEILWTAAVETDSGTPRMFWTGSELLLCSNSFYARIDPGDGSTILLDETGGLWLPGDGPVIVAYDAAEDVIYSAGYVDGAALIRTSDRASGASIAELDFTAELDARDPGTSRSDYPDECDYDDETLDCGGSTCDGYAGIDGCDSIDDEDDEGVCCQSAGTCCYMNFYDWAENRWYIKGTPEITDVHVMDSGKVVVVGAYTGSQYDEDGYHEPFTAEFSAASSSDDDSSACADSTSWYRKKSKNTCEKYVAKKAAKNCLKTDDDGVYAFEACPETCGSCGEACADDATWYKKKASQNCRWVVEGDGLERCEEKSAADGAYAYEACRFACRSCDATVCGA